MKAQMNFPSLDAPSWQQPIACPQHVQYCTALYVPTAARCSSRRVMVMGRRAETRCDDRHGSGARKACRFPLHGPWLNLFQASG